MESRDAPQPDPVEAPEADLAEQSQEWNGKDSTEDPRIDVDVPEADAIEQTQPAPFDEDDYR